MYQQFNLKHAEELDQMNFIDICSGIGGFRSALENHGHKCLAYSEIDKYAKQEIDELLEGITENTNIRIINIEVLGNIQQNPELFK